MLGLAHRGFSLNNYDRHLVPFLGTHGYNTVLCGVQHEGAGCFDHSNGAATIGYAEDITADVPWNESTVSPDGNATAAWDRENVDRAVTWLSSRKSTSPETPFFLSVGLYATHREFPTNSAVDPDLVRPLPTLPDTKETREDHSRFLEAIRNVDTSFGKVMGALERNGYSENTIVLFTTDHGVAQPYSKCNLNAAGQGVALTVRIPGMSPSQPFCDALVSTVDIFPTLIEILELETPPALQEAIQGRSFSHLFRNPTAEHREHVFGEVNFHTSYEPMRSVRTRRFNLVRNYDRHYPYVHLSNIDNSPAKDFLMAGGLAETEKSPVELYDLVLDPLERNNVVNDPRYGDTVQELNRVLSLWQEQTGDPLLRGELVPSRESVVNRPQCTEPDSQNPEDYLSLG